MISEFIVGSIFFMTFIVIGIFFNWTFAAFILIVMIIDLMIIFGIISLIQKFRTTKLRRNYDVTKDNSKRSGRFDDRISQNSENTRYQERQNTDEYSRPAQRNTDREKERSAGTETVDINRARDEYSRAGYATTASGFAQQTPYAENRRVQMDDITRTAGDTELEYKRPKRTLREIFKRIKTKRDEL